MHSQIDSHIDSFRNAAQRNVDALLCECCMLPSRRSSPSCQSNLTTDPSLMWISDGSVVRFQKTAVAVLASVVVFLKTAVAVVLKLTTVVPVITYNFNSTKNWRKKNTFVHT